MIRAFVLFIVTAAAFGLVALTAWHPELWEPWLYDRGITREDAMFRSGAKFILVIVVGIPLTALIYAIGRMGSDQSQRDIHGYTVLRLKTGTRWFSAVSLLGLAALFIAYPMVDPLAPAPWAFQAAGILCLLGIPVILNAKVRYDDATLSIPNSFGGRSMHQWSDLEAVKVVPEMKHYLFFIQRYLKIELYL